MNTNYIKKLRERLSNSIGLPFQNILTEKMIIKALNDENIKYRKRLYDPIITLWTFICQVLDDDKSCRKAISRTNALMANDENKLPSADTGAIIDAVIDSFTKQEITLFRLLYPHLSSGDIALGDRAFGSYADICLILQRGVDSVFRMHASRKVDFSKGKSLGIMTI
jgi:hypothetical protein